MRLKQVSSALSCPSTVSVMRQRGTCWKFKEQSFLSLLFDAWLAIPQENKKLYKQKALLRWLYHTLMPILFAYATDLQEALMALKRKLTGANVEGSVCTMLHFLWKQMVSRQKNIADRIKDMLVAVSELFWNAWGIRHIKWNTSSQVIFSLGLLFPFRLTVLGTASQSCCGFLDCQSVFSLLFF